MSYTSEDLSNKETKQNPGIYKSNRSENEIKSRKKELKLLKKIFKKASPDKKQPLIEVSDELRGKLKKNPESCNDEETMII